MAIYGTLTLADFRNYLHEALVAGYLSGYTNGVDAPDMSSAELLRAIKNAREDNRP